MSVSLHFLEHFLHVYWPGERGRGWGWDRKVEGERKAWGSTGLVEVEDREGGLGKDREG